MTKFWLAIVIFVTSIVIFPSQVFAQPTCAPQRVVNEWAQTCTSGDCQNQVYVGTPACDQGPCTTTPWNACVEVDEWVCNPSCDTYPNGCDCDGNGVIDTGFTYQDDCTNWTKTYGCWILGQCGDVCNTNADCLSNQCSGGLCLDGSGNSCTPPSGGGGSCPNPCDASILYFDEPTDDGCWAAVGGWLWGCGAGDGCTQAQIDTCNAIPDCPAGCGSNPTPTPTPSTCVIQGYKVLMPGSIASGTGSSGHSASAVTGQTVTVDGGSSTTSNPYVYSGQSSGSHTVAVTVPSGYSVDYSTCNNDITCHGVPPDTTTSNDSSAAVTCPAGGFTDLWFHYEPPKTCTVDITSPNGTPSPTVPAQIAITGNAYENTEDGVRLWMSDQNNGAAITGGASAIEYSLVSLRHSNGGFEDPTPNSYIPGWHFGSINRAVYSGGAAVGSKFMEVNRPCAGCESELPGQYTFYQDICTNCNGGSAPGLSGGDYTFSFRAKVNSAGSSVGVVVWEWNGSSWVEAVGTGTVFPGTSWTTFNRVYTLGGYGRTVRLQFYLNSNGTQYDFDEVTFTPDTTDVFNPTVAVGSFGQTFYRLDQARCFSSGYANCTATVNVTMPGGNYYAHCDVAAAPRLCSGNPFCSYEGLGGTNNCTGVGGWVSCSSGTPDDNDTFCSEGGPYWGACTAGTFSRTGTNDCSGSTTESCLGTINVKVIDATTLTSCAQAQAADQAGTLTQVDSVEFGVVSDVPIGADLVYTTISGAAAAGGNASLTNVRIPSTYRFNSIVSLPNGSPYTTQPRFTCLDTDGDGDDWNGSWSSSADLTTQGDATTMYIGLMAAFDPWFQVENGNIAAESNDVQAIVSTIPMTTCTGAPTCTPYVSLKSSGAADSSGHAVVGFDGSLVTSDVPTAPLAQIREDTGTAYGRMDRAAQREGYDYFYSLYSMGPNPTSLSNTNLTPYLGGGLDDSELPSNPERGAYYTGSDVTIDDPWDIASGQRVVIFVDGNLTVDLNSTDKIIVQNGGFLAFIVSGDINVSGDTGISIGGRESDGNLEGVYIADGSFIVNTQGAGVDELKFIGEGTFVGWSGITMERDYTNSNDPAVKIYNNTMPTEFFRARPDITMNTPDEMKRPLYDWQEINP